MVKTSTRAGAATARGAICAGAVLALLCVPASAPAADPSIGLRPGGATPEIVRASAEAGGVVHASLAWPRVQPTPGPFTWLEQDILYGNFLERGVEIRSVRITDAPDWAVRGDNCMARYSSCPPAPAHYDAFKRFVGAVVDRYGPGTPVGARRFVLWNEPNLPIKWGGVGHRRGSYREYSDLLARFHDAATEASRGVATDAGELVAGDRAPPDWAKRFTRYSTRRRRNGDYDALTLHAYSKRPEGVVDKIIRYGRFPGVDGVSVSEFAWGAGRPNPAVPLGGYKCAGHHRQASKFTRTVRLVRERTRHVPDLAWIQAVDQIRDKDIRCIDDTGHYKGALRRHVETYGLFKRAPDGSGSHLSPRPVLSAFRRAAG